MGLRSVFAALEAVPEAKHLMAVSFGRQGGQKGAAARMAKLSPERRSEIARLGGVARARQRRTKGGKRA